MKRLTTNKSVSEMSMLELAHNSCYRGRDGWARYRDYDMDIDARELAGKLLKDLAGGDDSSTCGDDFEEYITSCLEDGIDSVEGLIALFYRNLWAMADLRERLKCYEDLEGRLQTVYGECDGLLKKVVEYLERHESIDFPGPVHKARLLTDDEVDRWENFKRLEEQGKLLKLPCAVGDTVWYWDKDYDLVDEAPFEGYVSGYEIVSDKTAYIIIVQKKNFVPAWNDNSKCKVEIEEFGKTVFKFREEAEAALGGSFRRIGRW